MKSTLQVLIDARALIAKPENWWSGDSRREPGRSCALQALACGAADGTARAIAAYHPAILALAGDHASVIAFNDSHTHAEVLALFDRAIEAERAKQRQGVIDDLLADAAVPAVAAAELVPVP